MYQDIILI